MELDSKMMFRIAAVVLSFIAGLMTARISALSDRRLSGGGGNVLALLTCVPAVLCAFQGWEILTRHQRRQLGLGIEALLVHNVPPALIVGGSYLAGRYVAGLIWRGEQV